MQRGELCCGMGKLWRIGEELRILNIPSSKEGIFTH
jgi:hypothetical protein